MTHGDPPVAAAFLRDTSVTGLLAAVAVSRFATPIVINGNEAPALATPAKIFPRLLWKRRAFERKILSHLTIFDCNEIEITKFHLG